MREFIKKLKIKKKIYLNYNHLSLILRDFLGVKNIVYDNDQHLREAMNWLLRAQSQTGTGGVSGGYFFEKGWEGPYPETTGYIIPTFIKYGELVQDEMWIEKACAMADWEIDVQLEFGAVRGGMGVNAHPIVFNTGQVIIGWNALFKKTGDKKYLEAAIRASDWLVDIQDDDGKWSKNAYLDNPKVFHTRVAWPVFELYEITGNRKYKKSAEKNILWALSHVKGNWITNMGFKREDSPITHSIAYTLRGLLESANFMDKLTEEKIIDLVKEISIKIIDKFLCENHKRLIPAVINDDLSSGSGYSCLTGNAQLAIVFHKLSILTNNQKFKNAVDEIIIHMKQRQNIRTQCLDFRGGIPGSYPVNGKYMRYGFPNWATKFFADLLLLKEIE